MATGRAAAPPPRPRPSEQRVVDAAPVARRRAPSPAPRPRRPRSGARAIRQTTTSNAPSANGMCSAGARYVGRHARRRVERHDLSPASRSRRADVAAARRDVERRRAARGPRDEQLEVVALACAVARRGTARRARRPDVGHAGQLHRAARRLEHRRLRVEVRPAPPRRGCAGPPPRSCRRAGRRSGSAIVELVERREDPARDLVAARDPAEDVEEDRLHLRVARDHLERVDDALRVAAAAEVAEVRRPAAGEGDDVDGRHRQPGAVAEHAHLAVELHVGHALLAREALLGRHRLRIAHLGHVAVAVERVVVDRELRVERLHLAVGRDDQRVDLAEHRVGADEGGVEPLDDRRDLLLLARVLDPGAVDEPARLVTAGSPRAGRRGAVRARRGSPPRPARCRCRPAS